MGGNCSKNQNVIRDVDFDTQKNITAFFKEVSTIKNDDPRLNHMNIESFEFLSCIGKGGFSKVWKVKLKGTEYLYALKIINKEKAYNRKTITDIIKERDLMKSFNFPFIVDLDYSFDDDHYAYLAMKYNENGDFRKYLNVISEFSEKDVSKKF